MEIMRKMKEFGLYYHLKVFSLINLSAICNKTVFTLKDDPHIFTKLIIVLLKQFKYN